MRSLFAALCFVVGCSSSGIILLDSHACIVKYCMPDCSEQYTHNSADYNRDLRCTQCLKNCQNKELP